MTTKSDEFYMRRAIRLARKGLDRLSSLPMVGALVVSGGRVVSEGYAKMQEDAGATLLGTLDKAGDPDDATLYTTILSLERSPESSAIVSRLAQSRVSRLVIGTIDSGAATSSSLGSITLTGKSIVTGVCEQECDELNERYLKFRSTGSPFVTVKYAQTLDGRIATSTGDSQWISGAASLRLAHELRREHDAVIVGIGTVLRDDPQLTVRLVNGRNPVRVVIDSRLRIPHNARVLENSVPKCLVATTNSADRSAIGELEQLGVEVLVLPTEIEGNGVSLSHLLKILAVRNIGSVLVEGGAGIITSLLSKRLVDRLVIAVAPKVIGSGIEAVGNLGITKLEDAIRFASIKIRRLGADVIFDARLERSTGDAS